MKITDRSGWLRSNWLRFACSMAIALACGGVRGEPEGGLRVESEVFVEDGTEPVARSLTIFRAGLAWDFLERMGGSPRDHETDREADELVLHDPARERVVVVDPVRNVKTQIDTIRLERLSVSLAAWARKADDRLVRWAGGPDFGDGIQEKDSQLELVGPRVRYAVEFAPAPTEEFAQDYRRFADTAMLLKALLHPGGIPPFPRLAINRRISAAHGIPTAVTLEVDSRVAMIGGRPQVLRSVHKLHPRLLARDIQRIEDAEARMAVAEAVDLAAFMEPAPATPPAAAR